MNRFTPGPWREIPWMEDNPTARVVGPNGEPIATVYNVREEGPWNQALIASAPTLKNDLDAALLQNQELQKRSPHPADIVEELMRLATMAKEVIDDDLEERAARHALGPLHRRLEVILGVMEKRKDETPKTWKVGDKVFVPGNPEPWPAEVIEIHGNDWVSVRYAEGPDLRWKSWELTGRI